MVDKYVMDFIKKNHSKSSLKDLKKQIILAGYSSEDFEEALKKLKSDKGFKLGLKQQVVGPAPKTIPKKLPFKPVVIPKPVVKQAVKSSKPLIKPPIRQTEKAVKVKSKSVEPKIKKPLTPSKLPIKKPAKSLVRKEKVKREPIVKSLTKSISVKPSESSAELFPSSVKHTPIKSSSIGHPSVKHPSIKHLPEQTTEGFSISIISSKVPGSVYRNSLKIAGIYAILSIVFVILFFILEGFFAEAAEYRPMPISVISLILVSIFLIFFYYGFVLMGGRYNEKLIWFFGWIFLIAVIVSFFTLVSLLVFPAQTLDFLSEYLISISLDTSDFGLILWGLFGIPLFWIIAGLNILLGIGLVALKKDVKFAFVPGILSIVGGILLVFGVGAIVLLIAFIFEAILFFRESRRE